MATATFVIIAALQLLAAGQLTVNTVIISHDHNGKETCPSHDEQKSAILKVNNNVWITLANLSFVPECGDGLWKRVAYLNMSDPLEQCPSAWRLYSTNGIRACRRPDTSRQSCPAVVYPTGQHYQRVCGRIIGYQVATPAAFSSAHADQQPTTLDDPYVDGVSVTHGHPREHIWTFAAGITEGISSLDADCPCSNLRGSQPPDYVGNDYYCESGNSFDTAIESGHLYSNDPLWDGQQCEGQCCSNGKSPPWFTVQLSNPTLDDIEVRICADEGTDNEDTPVELIEIYIN